MHTVLKLTVIVCIVLLVTARPAIARGGYGYHYGHGYHGYHSGIHARYHSHGGIGTAGAVVLGLLGVVVLAELLDDVHYDRPRRVARSAALPAYPRAAKRPPDYPRTSRRTHEPLPSYDSNAGWEQLKAGNSERAMTVFAIQSQQNLHSGVPKIGFALAAAANNETERAIWSMRRAVKQDPGALDQVVVDTKLHQLIRELDDHYSARNTNKAGQSHEAFMVATLSYLQRDLDRARNALSPQDQSASTARLRRLLAVPH